MILMIHDVSYGTLVQSVLDPACFFGVDYERCEISLFRRSVTVSIRYSVLSKETLDRIRKRMSFFRQLLRGTTK